MEDFYLETNKPTIQVLFYDHHFSFNENKTTSLSN